LSPVGLASFSPARATRVVGGLGNLTVPETHSGHDLVIKVRRAGVKWSLFATSGHKEAYPELHHLLPNQTLGSHLWVTSYQEVLSLSTSTPIFIDKF